jgi:hypothetical protein
MSRTDLFKPKAEGSIDFSVQDINKLAAAIRREPLTKDMLGNKKEEAEKEVQDISTNVEKLTDDADE